MKGALAKALVDEQAGMAASDPLVANIRRVLKAMFAFSPDVLAELGLQSPTRRVPTVATKTSAVAKRLATRAAATPWDGASASGSTASSGIPALLASCPTPANQPRRRPEAFRRHRTWLAPVGLQHACSDLRACEMDHRL
jgi:hypothetical protein